MKKIFLLLLSSILLGNINADADTFFPKASQDAQVVTGKARFTVLTPRLIRIEWAEDSRFEDSATLGIVNRNLEVPSFDVKKSKSKVVIKTSEMTLTYTGQDRFSEDNLSISFKMADPSAKKGVKTVVWRPGMDDSGNLLSTARTLDKCDGIKTLEPYEEPYERFVEDYLGRTSNYDGPKGYVYDDPYQFAGNNFKVGKAGEKAPVSFRICQMEWADAFFNSIIQPFDKQGVDFWKLHHRRPIQCRKISQCYGHQGYDRYYQQLGKTR